MKPINELNLRPTQIPTESVNELNAAIAEMTKIAESIKQESEHIKSQQQIINTYQICL